MQTPSPVTAHLADLVMAAFCKSWKILSAPPVFKATPVGLIGTLVHGGLLAPASNMLVTGVGRMSVVPVPTGQIAESPESGFSDSWSCHRMAVGFVIVEVGTTVSGDQLDHISARTRECGLQRVW